MSATVPVPASEAAPSGNGIAKPNGSPAQPVSVPAGGPSAELPAQDNWEKRAKDFQSEKDKLQARYQPLSEKLRTFNLDEAGGIRALDEYDAILKQPQLRAAVVDFFKTGKVNLGPATPTPAPTDEYVDPDVVKLREELAQVREQLATVSRNAHSTASTQVSGLINQHENEFLGNYSLTPEERQRFAESFSQQFNWMVEKHPEQLMNMQRSTYRRIALPVLDEILGERGILGLAERGLAQRQQGVAARATDAPLRAQTTGAEPAAPAQFSAAPRETELKRVAREAAAEYRRSRGLAQ